MSWKKASLGFELSGAMFYLAHVVLLLTIGCSPSVDARDKPAPGKPPENAKEAKPSTPTSDNLSKDSVIDANQPKSVEVPHVPTDLWVEGFRNASHVGPDKPAQGGSPVVIILHGNYDRPEWECDLWKEVAGFYGWTLCPRGIPTPWADRAADRWMYQSRKKAVEEIDAALRSLKATYPGQVRDDGTVLVGFSLGAMYAPNIAIESPGKYSWLYLVEGGASQLDKPRISSLKKAGVLGIGMAMSTGSNRNAAAKALGNIKKSGLKVVYVNMAGAGHSYKYDFEFTGRQSLMELLGLPNSSPETTDAHGH